VSTIDPPPPLEGVRVVDFSWIVAGPQATRILADFGADVIRVEYAGRIDSIRIGLITPGTPAGSMDSSGFFHNLNRNKRSITLNINDPRGLAAIRRLLAVSGFGVGFGRLQPAATAEWALAFKPLPVSPPWHYLFDVLAGYELPMLLLGAAVEGALLPGSASTLSPLVPLDLAVMIGALGATVPIGQLRLNRNEIWPTVALLVAQLACLPAFAFLTALSLVLQPLDTPKQVRPADGIGRIVGPHESREINPFLEPRHLEPLEDVVRIAIDHHPDLVVSALGGRRRFGL